MTTTRGNKILPEMLVYCGNCFRIISGISVRITSDTNVTTDYHFMCWNVIRKQNKEEKDLVKNER